jgi:hypothetical protein
MSHPKQHECAMYCLNSYRPRDVVGNNVPLCCLSFHYSGSYGQDLHILAYIQNMPDVNLDVPGNVALAFETIVLFLHINFLRLF